MPERDRRQQVVHLDHHRDALRLEDADALQHLGRPRQLEHDHVGTLGVDVAHLRVTTGSDGRTVVDSPRWIVTRMPSPASSIARAGSRIR